MQPFCLSKKVKALTFGLFVLGSVFTTAQTVHFHQNFTKTTSLINPQPDTGQFSHIILTSPALSYYKFHKGYMELVRTQQDSASGGIIRVLRATPFLPNPKSLIIKIRLNAELIQSNAVNAVYLYVGENFDPVNNSFPSNDNMFGKCSINFLNGTINIKDLGTQLTSEPVAAKKTVTLTWVLNNSEKTLNYHLQPGKPEQSVQPGYYDLWLDEEAISKGTKAYSGNTPYSPTKLSNFEMRFRNGLGKIRIQEILIMDGSSSTEPGGIVVRPNPVSAGSFTLNAQISDPASLVMLNLFGSKIPFKTRRIAPEQIEIMMAEPLSAGMYIIYFNDPGKKRQVAKVLVQ